MTTASPLTGVPLRVSAWMVVVVGVVVTTILALSVHAVMLDVLHVPYPSNFPHTGFPAYLNGFFLTLATLLMLPLLDERYRKHSRKVQCLLLFVLIASVRETLFRYPFMEIVNSTSIVYPILQTIPRLIPLAFLAVGAVLSADVLKRTVAVFVGAILLSAIVFAVLQPLVNDLFALLLKSFAYLDSPSLYTPPYDYHILIPAYLSFLEPVIATFFAAALCWSRLPGKPPTRVAMFTVLIWFMKGPVLSPFIYILYAHSSATKAMLSEGQFSFEAIALALLAAFSWSLVMKLNRLEARSQVKKLQS